jgi:hypothetical protein
MRLQLRAPACALLVLGWPCLSHAQEWSEERVIERFLDRVRTSARHVPVESVRAEAVGRALLPNPNAVVSREGAATRPLPDRAAIADHRAPRT